MLNSVYRNSQIPTINLHANSRSFLNTSHFGFTAQKSTVVLAMEVKKFVKERLAAGEVIALINLDVKGAFDAAFRPPY